MSGDSSGAAPYSPHVKAHRLRWLFRSFQVLVVLLVVWGIGKAVERARRELDEHRRRWQEAWQEVSDQLQRKDLSAEERRKWLAQQQRLHRGRLDQVSLHPGWLVVCGGCYAASSLLGWSYWCSVLRAMGQRPGWWPTYRAYHIGNLGKYVPGKAMVVILRTAMVQGPQVAVWAAVASVFVETLTYMAVAAALAAALLPVLPWTGQRHVWVAASALTAILLVAVTWPPVFQAVVARLWKGRHPPFLSEALRGLTGKLIVRGWLIFPPAWVCIGLSFWAAAHSLPGETRQAYESLQDLPMLIAVAALAVVLGFVSFLPGGIGVRELVISVVLAPHAAYGTYRALAVAVVVRVVWLATELLLACIGLLPTLHSAGSPLWRMLSTRKSSSSL